MSAPLGAGSAAAGADGVLTTSGPGGGISIGPDPGTDAGIGGVDGGATGAGSGGGGIGSDD